MLGRRGGDLEDAVAGLGELFGVVFGGEVVEAGGGVVGGVVLLGLLWRCAALLVEGVRGGGGGVAEAGGDGEGVGGDGGGEGEGVDGGRVEGEGGGGGDGGCEDCPPGLWGGGRHVFGEVVVGAMGRQLRLLVGAGYGGGGGDDVAYLLGGEAVGFGEGGEFGVGRARAGWLARGGLCGAAGVWLGACGGLCGAAGVWLGAALGWLGLWRGGVRGGGGSGGGGRRRLLGALALGLGLAFWGEEVAEGGCCGGGECWLLRLGVLAFDAGAGGCGGCSGGGDAEGDGDGRCCVPGCGLCGGQRILWGVGAARTCWVLHGGGFGCCGGGCGGVGGWGCGGEGAGGGGADGVGGAEGGGGAVEGGEAGEGAVGGVQEAEVIGERLRVVRRRVR